MDTQKVRLDPDVLEQQHEEQRRRTIRMGVFGPDGHTRRGDRGPSGVSTRAGPSCCRTGQRGRSLARDWTGTQRIAPDSVR